MARVTRRQPEYDWSGIAMLAQQLTGLFEPSKAKLQSRAQEHEMRKLEAVQAWEFGKEQLETNRDSYEQVLKDIEAYKGKLDDYGPDVMSASLKDGALPENASKIHDDNDIRKLSDLNDLAGVYHDKYMNLNKKLNTMKEMDTNAEFGKAFSKNMQAKVTETRERVKGKDYKTIHDANKDSALDWNEQNNALRDYMADYYTAAEGEEGITINVGGVDVENVKSKCHSIPGWVSIRQTAKRCR